MKNILVLLFVCLLVCACSGNKLITKADLTNVHEGSTTKEQIREMFGEPSSEDTFRSEECWTYRHSDSSFLKEGFGIPQKEKVSIMTFCFNDAGILQHVTNASKKDWKNGLTW